MSKFVNSNRYLSKLLIFIVKISFLGKGLSAMPEVPITWTGITRHIVNTLTAVVMEYCYPL